MEELKRRGVAAGVLVAVLVAFTLQRASAGDLIRALVIDLVVLIVAAFVVWPRVRWLVPAVVPLLVAGVLAQFANQDQVSLAVLVPAVIGTALTICLAFGIDVERHVDAALGRVARVLEVMAGVFAFGIAVLPAWAWTRLRRHDVLGRSPEVAWSVPTDRAGPASLAASPEVVGHRRTVIGSITWAIGCVALLLAVNFGAGWLWDQRYPTDPVTSSDDAGRIEPGELPRDPRNDLPSMAAYPWRERYFEDIQRTQNGYWPFTESRPLDFSSPYVNQRDWVRLSHEPEGDASTMPTVWMFGGSTTWGEGQRDGYTIASWISRLAEEDGVPLRIANYGQRGWTHFQEMILFEQRAATTSPPDLAIFYDGANEVSAQSLLNEAVPTHTLTYAYAKKLLNTTIATQFRQEPADAVTVGEVTALYKEHSAVHKIVDLFRPGPAGASPAQDSGDDELAPEFTPLPEEGNETGLVTNYVTTDQDGIDAGQVYERSKALTLQIAERYAVEPLLFWQPMGYRGSPQQRAIEQLTDPTIDISDTLVGKEGEVFIDGGHTNEEGARLVAVEIWEHLEPEVRAWYEEQG